MSRTGRKFVVAYVGLVGLPLLALAGVLKAGSHLSAPISVDGSWKVEADPASPAAQSCAADLSALVTSPLVISQSGKNLVVSFTSATKASGFGAIERKNVSASIATLSPVASCGSSSRILLSALVDPTSEPRTLAGSLSVDGCIACAPIRLRAVRLPRNPTGAAH